MLLLLLGCALIFEALHASTLVGPRPWRMCPRLCGGFAPRAPRRIPEAPALRPLYELSLEIPAACVEGRFCGLVAAYRDRLEAAADALARWRDAEKKRSPAKRSPGKGKRKLPQPRERRKVSV